MRKIGFKTLMALLLIVLLIAPTFAAQVRELDWADLIKKVEFEDPFEALTPEQLGDLSVVARLRQLQATGHQVSEEPIKEMKEATLRLKKAGVDIDTQK